MLTRFIKRQLILFGILTLVTAVVLMAAVPLTTDTVSVPRNPLML